MLPSRLPLFLSALCALMIFPGALQARDRHQFSPQTSSRAQFLIARGRKLSVELKPHEALECYNEAVRLAPSDPALYFKRAELCESCGFFDRAIKDYNTLARMRPADAGVYRHRARVYVAMGNDKKAVDDYSASIRMDAKDPSAHRDLGAALSRLGQNEKAIAEYKKARSMFVGVRSQETSKLATLYMKTGQYDKAIEEYSTLIGMGPDIPQFYISRAEAFDKIGKKKEAAQDRRRADAIQKRL